MVSPYVKAELTAAVTNLGYSEGNKYYKEEYCVDALKDLIRFLRRDDTTFAIRRELGQMKLVTLHLLPIMCEYHTDDHLFDVVLRLILNLTSPTMLLYNEELPTDKVQRNQYLQIVSHLQSYKPTLASSKLWNVLTDKLKVLLVKEPEERMEDDRLLTERILILIRNILDIPITPDDEKRTDDDASVHDMVLWSMHQSGLEDVILYLASNENERSYCMHVMEIISLMLREQNPVNLANAAAQRSVVEQKKETEELVNLAQREAAEREARYRKMTSSRSSIFRGTFCVKDVKSISEKELIVHKSSPDVKTIDFSAAKQQKKKAKNRLPLAGGSDGTRRSTLAIRLMLKEFCIEILNGAYNTLMHTVKDCLVRMRTQEHDETYYLWAMKFFMEFNRNSKFKVELVTETISVGIFHYIQTLVEKYSEMIVVDKKKVASWSRRLHMAVRAYQELLMTINAMDRYGSEEIKRSSRILKSNVFYVLEYREMCMVLLQNYKETQHSVSYLKDLVETAHIFLKLFETHSQGTRHFMIEKKARAKIKRKKSKPKKETPEDKVDGPGAPPPPPEFDEIAGEIAELLQKQPELPDGMRPYDPLNDAPMDDQKMAALHTIQKLLKETKIAAAVAYLRASRDVWPEGEVFGALDVRPEEELLLLREIFTAALPEVDGKRETEDREEEDDDEEDEIEREEMAVERATKEEELHFDEFVRRFAHRKIVEAYCSLLRRYATNSTLTNHCLVKMLHRIAFDCKMPTMLFQLSLFKTFQKIMEDPKAKADASIKELGKFGAYIVRKFAEASLSNPKVFVELLFWKTARDAAEIDACYGDVQESSASGSRSVWAEEEEDELQRLYEEFKDAHDPERDVVDRIMANMIKQDRSRRLVIKKLKDMGLISGAKDVARTKHSVRVRPPKEWAQNEITELRRIFEEVRDSSDPLGLLIDRLPVRRSKRRVRDKIVELGLVANVKELRKKRAGWGKSKKKTNKANLYEDSDEENRPPREGASDSERSTTDDETESSDEESDREKEKLKKQKKSKKMKEKRKQYGFGASDADSFAPEALGTSLRQLLESGRKGGLQWLLGCLRETFADRLDDEEDDANGEAIPLLPLDGAAREAMEDHAFLKFIADMGLAPPANEQEQYWRIPVGLKARHLRARIDYLEKSIEEGAERMETESVRTNSRSSSRASNKSGKRSASPPPSSNANKKRRRIVQSDSDEESDAAVAGPSIDVEPQESTDAPTKASRKRLAILDSDSE